MKIKSNKSKSNKKILIAIATFSVAILCAMVVLVFVKGPEIIKIKVKNFEIVQDDYNLNLTWDEMDCKGYDIIIWGPGHHERIQDLSDTSYVIEDIELDKEYKITITARLESGYDTRPVTEEFTTKKLEQNIETNIESVDGVKGNKLKLKAKAESSGELTYKSKNEKIATISEEGVITLKKSGKTTIVVKSEEDDVYATERKKIDIAVYPETLAAPENVKTDNVSDTRVKVTWDAVDFANQYELLKKNAATDKYEKIATTDGETREIEITRDNGSYKVRGITDVTSTVAELSGSDEKINITGEKSEGVKIEGTAASAKSYSSSKTLMTLDKSNLEVLKQINGDGGTNVPQSFSMTDDCYVVSYVNSGGSAGKLISYSRKDGSYVSMSSASGMGFANGSTYNPNTNKFYVVKTHKSYRTAECSTYDGTTKKSTGKFNLPKVTSGIAYDVSNDKYYLSKGNEIYVCDSDFNVEKFIHKSIRYNHAQDIGAYNGVVMVCTWVSGSTSYIDLYRASDGNYLGSYYVPLGEIESVVVDDGYLIILMNTIGSSHDYIYKSKERISIP